MHILYFRTYWYKHSTKSSEIDKLAIFSIKKKVGKETSISIGLINLGEEVSTQRQYVMIIP